MFYAFSFFLFSFFSFLVSGIETSFFSMSNYEIEKMSNRLRYLKILFSNKNPFLVFLVSLNTFFNVGIIIMFYETISLLDIPKIFEIFFLLIYIPLFCEILPKTLSLVRKDFFLKSFLIFYPFFSLYIFFVRLFFKNNKKGLKKFKSDFDSIYFFIEENKENFENEIDFLKNYHFYKDKKISQILSPEKISIYIQKGSFIKDALKIFLEKRIFYLPVLDDEKFSGVLNFKNIFLEDQNKIIDNFIEDIPDVDYDTSFSKVLNFMIEKNTYIVFIHKDDEILSTITLDDLVNLIMRGK